MVAVPSQRRVLAIALVVLMDIMPKRKEVPCVSLVLLDIGVVLLLKLFVQQVPYPLVKQQSALRVAKGSTRMRRENRSANLVLLGIGVLNLLKIFV